MDGPNYERVFQEMKVFHGGDPNDVKVIKQYLRFYQDTEQFDLYAKHYLPMLSEEDRAEFEPNKSPETPAEVNVEVVDETVTGTVVLSVPTPKKRGRPSKK